jgi:hypothetical protein
MNDYDATALFATCSELRTKSAQTENIAHFQTTLSENKGPLRTALGH